MAKYETSFAGDFDEVLGEIEKGITRGSISASLEDGSDFCQGNIRCAVRVFERYSMIGSNRVSLNVVLIGDGDTLYVSAITSGGSQAVFFKINTFGEQAFLDRVVAIIKKYE